MQKIKEMIFRVIILLVGLTIAHLGVTLFLLANLGSDPFNVFIQGIFRMLDTTLLLSFITHGRVHMCISFLIILILLIVDRSYVKIGTILCMFCAYWFYPGWHCRTWYRNMCLCSRSCRRYFYANQ